MQRNRGQQQNVHLVSLIFLKRSLVFPILLLSSISLHWSLKKAFLSLLAILWNSAFGLYFPDQGSNLCILHWEPWALATRLWKVPISVINGKRSWSLSPVQCHKPHSIGHQALYLSEDHPHGKEMQKSKMADWGGLTNSSEKKRGEKQRRKGKI